ncbi:MAG: helix-turn-helix transcriptional regulator [Oscillospiraceae bacterium]|nr:helix-turn-helix transcriptional regulator [Oscillospiraceae bacterium]MBR6657147.1 helix-turn-helix transcriptional regulator [Oscillospiraceae bacterium]
MLKVLRKKNRITQRDLAIALHISQTSVSKYERGESEPDLEMIIKMADFFGVSIDEFVRGKKFDSV